MLYFQTTANLLVAMGHLITWFIVTQYSDWYRYFFLVLTSWFFFHFRWVFISLRQYLGKEGKNFYSSWLPFIFCPLRMELDGDIRMALSLCPPITLFRFLHIYRQTIELKFGWWTPYGTSHRCQAFGHAPLNFCGFPTFPCLWFVKAVAMHLQTNYSPNWPQIW